MGTVDDDLAPPLPKGYAPVKQDASVPALPKGFSPVGQKKNEPTSPPADVHAELNSALQAYQAHLTPQEHAAFQQTQQAIANKPVDRIRAATKSEQESQKAMDTTLGKVNKSLAYIGSETSKGGVDLLKGGAWVLNHMNTNLNDSQLVPDKAFKGIDNATDLGITPGQREQIEGGKGMGWGSVRTLGMLGNIAPAAIGGEAAGIPKTMFTLQGLGQGKDTMDKIDPDHKLNPAVRDLYIAGSGAANGLIVGDLGENFLSKPVQEKIVSGIVGHALQDAAEKGLSEDVVKSSIKSATRDFTDVFNSYAEKTAKAGVDLSALQAAQFALKKGVDVASPEPVFNENLGTLMNNISDVVTKQAPLFGGVGAMLDGKPKDPVEVQKRDLGGQVDALDKQITQKEAEEPQDAVGKAEQKVALDALNKQKDELTNNLETLISKQHDESTKVASSEKEIEGEGKQVAERPGNTTEVQKTADEEKNGEGNVKQGAENAPLKKEEDAIQKPSTKSVPVQPKAEGSEGVSKGDTKGQEPAKETEQPRPQRDGDTESQDAEKEVKKTILTKRAYEGDIQPEVKKHLEEKGLTRKSFSQQERSDQATEFIKKFGDDAAHMAVKNGDIEGAMAASVLHQLIIKNNRLMTDLSPESAEYEALAKKNADLIDLVEKKGYSSGEFVGQLAHEYQSEELNFASIKRNLEKSTGKPLSEGQQKKVKQLVSDNEKLKKQLDTAEKRLIEETDKAFKSGVEEGKGETKTQKAKRIADKIRQGKLSRPGVFSAATPASVVWDGAVEVVAKSVEAGGKLADAIDAGLSHIKASDWYKGLSDSKKSQAETEFKKHHIDNSGSTDLDDLQERFVDKKGIKFTPNEAKDIWKYIKDTYIANGSSYQDAISKTADDLGLTWRQVNEAIVTPKTKPMSNEMWKRQYDLSRYRMATKGWIEDQKRSPIVKAFKNVSGALRGLMVFGHGAIFSGTHAGMTFFSPATFTKSINAFLDGWKFAYGNTGKYQMAMEELKNSPNYIVARRAGLKNDPDRLDLEEYQKSQSYLEKLGMGKIAHSGERGFNAIKVLRQGLFDYHYEKLTPAEKADPAVAKSVADIINLATGASPSKLPNWFQEATFAGGMEVARWQKFTSSPAKAANTAIKAITQPNEVTPAERVFAKVWAKRAGIQLATLSTALVANSILQKRLNPNNPVNYTNPDAFDFGKFKFGDISIDPTSGMRGTGLFIYKLGKIPFNAPERGENRIKTLGKDLASYSKGKLSPFYSDLAEVYTKRDFSENVVPWSDEKPSKYAHKLGYGEYIWNKMPLPIAEAAAVTYKSAQDNGGDPTTIDNLMKGIISGGLSGSTGFRVSEDGEKKEKNKFSIKANQTHNK